MKPILILITTAVLLLAPAPLVEALEIGEQIGPARMGPGGVICDTEAQARRAIDRLERKNLLIPDGCGVLRGQPLAFVEAIATYDSGRAVYTMLQIIFLPPASLGVQYSWVVGKPTGEAPKDTEVPPEPIGQTI